MHKRIAFKMKLNQGEIEAYKKRHDELWPDLHTLLKEAGLSEYSIFFDEETHILFAFQKQSGEHGSQDLGKREIVQKWWKYMSDIMETNPDGSPVTILLREVFYME
jgi:L-rhamnose mutarotase